MSNCFRKGGGDKIFFLRFLVVTKQVYSYVNVLYGEILHIYMELHALVTTCTFIPNSEKESSKFQSCRKGTQKHKLVRIENCQMHIENLKRAQK